ncbi:TonB-dependent receptor plug domain-containing protein [Sphingomonas sp. 2378]|uniref:TonB-dependent receptor plug domain-containing protein n=1 Tax=Sphingomonas sp. 2378 TaxID=1219748 RepID=UPI00311AF753
MRITLSAALWLASSAMPALAQEAPPAARDAQDNSFRLGEIIVTGARPEGVEIGSESVGQEAIYKFDRQSLDEAANLIPGVTAGNSGGSRNERLLFVRGFDRFQVPVSIDGIRVYLPADNRLDYGRFLTPDVAQIQVAKGYASVLDGPGAMGGAVNLVTRKPTKTLEIEGRAQLNLDRGLDYAGYNAFGLIGTRRDRWYAQASYAMNDTDHWDLPGSFTPTANENGGARDFSATRDWRVNAKVGFTPNATDEYSLSYTRQEGEKNAPLHITDPISTQRNWSWPYWNIESIYFLSTTALGDRATLRTRVYRNTFDNLLSAFDDRTQTTQTRARAFNSYYEDESWGGSAELALRPTDADRLSLAVHYRRDQHDEFQQGFPSGFTEPRQRSVEDTYSIAGEYARDLTPTFVLTLGASYDWRDLSRAEEYGTPPTGGAARIFSYPLRNADAWNAQGRIEWKPVESSRLYASISSRARFPTLFERFSTQFGTAASNPGLNAERATNYELGGSHAIGALTVTAALFYGDINNAIVAVRPAGFPANTSQRRNLGSADYYGGEIGIVARVGPTLDLGANYTHIERDFTISPQTGVIIPAFELTDVPSDKGFVYASWRPFTRLELTPSVEFASNRTTVTTASPPVYYRTGSYVRADIRTDLALTERLSLGVGARNLFDAYYTLTDGFPEAGRSFFAVIRARY